MKTVIIEKRHFKDESEFFWILEQMGVNRDVNPYTLVDAIEITADSFVLDMNG